MAKNINLDSLKALADLVNILSSQEEPQEAPQEEVKEEIKKEKKQETPHEEEKLEEPETPSEEEVKEAKKQAQREDRYINKSLATQFEKAGIAGDMLDSLKGFIDYDKLKDDSGDANEEKITEFADLLARVSRREPPKGDGGKRALDDDGGIAKYLPNK